MNHSAASDADASSAGLVLEHQPESLTDVVYETIAQRDPDGARKAKRKHVHQPGEGLWPGSLDEDAFRLRDLSPKA
jgi:DNA-binding FadR family transcriptional regulator